jgi:hypothetical protein
LALLLPQGVLDAGKLEAATAEARGAEAGRHAAEAEAEQLAQAVEDFFATGGGATGHAVGGPRAAPGTGGLGHNRPSSLAQAATAGAARKASALVAQAAAAQQRAAAGPAPTAAVARVVMLPRGTSYVAPSSPLLSECEGTAGGLDSPRAPQSPLDGSALGLGGASLELDTLLDELVSSLPERERASSRGALGAYYIYIVLLQG